MGTAPSCLSDASEEQRGASSEHSLILLQAPRVGPRAHSLGGDHPVQVCAVTPPPDSQEMEFHF